MQSVFSYISSLFFYGKCVWIYVYSLSCSIFFLFGFIKCMLVVLFICIRQKCRLHLQFNHSTSNGYNKHRDQCVIAAGFRKSEVLDSYSIWPLTFQQSSNDTLITVLNFSRPEKVLCNGNLSPLPPSVSPTRFKHVYEPMKQCIHLLKSSKQ